VTVPEASGGTDEFTGLRDVRRVFFSFPQVLDPARHRDYNAWHQYDHLPQNRALPGVRHGERWVRSPRCRDAGQAGNEQLSADLDAAQYVAMYWFSNPPRASIEEWLRLGTSTGEIGRRPEVEWTERRFTGFFAPADAAVSSDALVSVGAVPFLPHAGVVIDVTRASWESAPALDLAALAALPGAHGAYAFDGLGEADGLRVTMLWTDADPTEVAAALPPVHAGTLLRTPLETIVPGAWDWFTC
jgi:hypothetical protein